VKNPQRDNTCTRKYFVLGFFKEPRGLGVDVSVRLQ